MVGCPGSACTTREDLGTRVAHGGCGCLPTRSLRSKRPPAGLTRTRRVSCARGASVHARRASHPEDEGLPYVDEASVHARRASHPEDEGLPYVDEASVHARQASHPEDEGLPYVDEASVHARRASHPEDEGLPYVDEASVHARRASHPEDEGLPYVDEASVHARRASHPEDEGLPHDEETPPRGGSVSLREQVDSIRPSTMQIPSELGGSTFGAERPGGAVPWPLHGHGRGPHPGASSKRPPAEASRVHPEHPGCGGLLTC